MSEQQFRIVVGSDDAGFDYKEVIKADLAKDPRVASVVDVGVDGLRLDAVHALGDDSDYHFLAELSNRVLELTPEGVQVYGGGYTEYVQSTGQEAPGLRS